MGLKWFPRKKEEKVETLPAQEKPTLLQEICGQEKEVYEFLRNFLFLNPEMMKTNSDELIERARKEEEAGEKDKAMVSWRIAGGLALYEGNLEKVKLCFSQYERLSGKDLKISEIAEKVLERAREYYQKRKVE
jgi:hypothetical protein